MRAGFGAGLNGFAAGDTGSLLVLLGIWRDSHTFSLSLNSVFVGVLLRQYRSAVLQEQLFSLMLHAAANGIVVDHVESFLEGNLDVQGFLGLDDSVRNGYQGIKVSFKIEGDLTDEQRQKLMSFAYMSPVFDIVTNKVPVALSLQA